MGSYVELGDYADLEVPINTDFTICGWVYITSFPLAGEIGYIYCKGSATGAAASACHFSVDENGIVTFGVGEGAPTSGASVIPTNKWVFIWGKRSGTGADNVTFGWTADDAGTFDTSYKGVVSDNTTVGDTATKATFMAKDDASGDDNLLCKLDQWYFSDSYAYTVTELTSIYNNGVGTEQTSIGGRSNRVYFSDNGDFDTWTATSYFDIPTNNKQQSVNCITDYFDTLVIGLSNEIWTLYGSGGDPETDWALKKSNSSVGMKDTTSTAIVDGLLFFISPDNKVWAFDGNTSYQVGEPMANPALVGHQTMVSYKGSLYGIYADGVYKYNGIKKQWSKSDQDVNCLFTDGVYLFGGGYSSVQVYQLETGTNMAGNDINSYWETRWEDFGDPDQVKTMFDAYIYLEEQTHSGALKVEFYKDYEITPVVTFAVYQSSAYNPENGQRLITGLTGARGRHWKFKVWSNAVDEPYSVIKLLGRYTLEEDAN
jgi:hypothetical protein